MCTSCFPELKCLLISSILISIGNQADSISELKAKNRRQSELCVGPQTLDRFYVIQLTN